MTPIEIENQINIVEARIEQMKNHELYNDMEKRDNLANLSKELEELLLKKARNIEGISQQVK